MLRPASGDETAAGRRSAVALAPGPGLGAVCTGTVCTGTDCSGTVACLAAAILPVGATAGRCPVDCPAAHAQAVFRSARATYAREAEIVAAQLLGLSGDTSV